MSKTRFAVLGLAIGSAVLAAYLASGFLTREAPKTEVVAVNTVATSDVLVALKDVQMGERLGGGQVGWQSWPERSVTPQMITKAVNPNAALTYEQARARSDIFEGEPIIEKKLVLQSQNGFMSAILPKGMRAVSVRISEETGAGGFILPNDRVDVILTRKADEAGADRLANSETVLTDVRVLAIDQTFRQDKDSEQVVVAKRTATLELDPHQAEVVSMVETAGLLSLSLRSIAENDGKPLADVGPRLSEKYSNSSSGTDLRIVKYGISKRYSNH
jgi:pilus assembly protein CpaB